MSLIELESKLVEPSESDEIFNITYSDQEKPVKSEQVHAKHVPMEKGLPPLPKGSLFWSNWLYTALLIAFSIFVCIAIIVGVLVVYFGSRKDTNFVCVLTFKRTIQSFTGYDSRPRFIAVGYLNNDSQIDLAVANSGTDNIGIFLGYANGTFADQVTFSTGYKSQPYSVAVADMNHDNKQDVVVAYYGFNSIAIHYGDGQGNLINPQVTSLGAARPISLSIADFNKDTYLDIAVINNGTSNVIVLLGHSDGSFEIFTSYYMGYDSVPYAMAVADLNNDRFLDIAIVNYGTSTITILTGNGDATFNNSLSYSTGKKSNPCSITIGDFNQDQQLDLAIVNSGTSTMGIVFGYNNGTFSDQVTYSTGLNSRPSFIASGDFNSDNRTDLAVVNSQANNVMIFEQTANKTMAPITTHWIEYGSQPSSFVIVDYDQDDRPDAILANTGGNNILLLSQYASNPVVNLATYLIQTAAYPIFVATRDFNKDGQLDIVVLNQATSTIGILFGQGNGTFTNLTLYSVGNTSQPYFLAIGDVNNDQQLDLVVVLTSISEILILLGNADGTFRYGNQYSTGNNSTPYSIVLVDLNNDTFLDIIVGNVVANNIAIFLGNNDGTFADYTTYSIQSGSNFISVSTGDVNHDNVIDIVTANFGSNSFCVLLGYGNGSFHDGRYISTGSDQPSDMILGDVNSDGKLDIVYTSPTSYIVGVLYGLNDGSFTSIIRYSAGTGSYPWALTLGYFNQDDIVDIGVANLWDSTVSIFLGSANSNVNSAFTLSYKLSTGALSQPADIVLSDVNKDGYPDIIVANSGTSNVGVLLITFTEDFQSNLTFATGSAPHPSSVAVGDFNHDNQVDIVVANTGNNNIQVLYDYYQGSSSKELSYSTGTDSNPQYVVVGDINHDNQLDIVVANYLDDTIHLFAGNSNGTFETLMIMSLGSQVFPKALALGDFNHDEWLDIVVANEGADNLAVFLAYNYPTFTRTDMPVPGTTPSPFYVLTADFNLDNHSDIAVLNRYADTIGIYLGNGMGSFSDQITTNLVPSSSSTALLAIDFNKDGYMDLMVSNYQRETLGLFLGFGNGSFNVQYEWGSPQKLACRSIASGDFNEDGNIDILVANDDLNRVEIYFGNGVQSVTKIVALSTGNLSTPSYVRVGDFNHDQHLDIAVADYGTMNVAVFLGFGNASFARLVLYTTNGAIAPRVMAIGDLNNDGNIDIVVGDGDSYNIGIFFGSTNGTFSSIVTYAIISQPFISSINIIDLNNDNALDIVMTDWGLSNNNLGTLAILYGHGNGQFAVLKTYIIGLNTEPSFAAFADFNQDTRMDIVTANYYSDSLSVLFRLSNEPFATATMYSTGNQSNPDSLAVGDMDNDANLDVIVTNSGTDNLLIYYGDGLGSFETIMSLSTGVNSMPSGVAVSDVNHDNFSDILVINSQTNDLLVFLNRANKSFALQGNYSTGLSSNPSAISVNCLNNDTHPDLVVANFDASNVLVFYGNGNGTFMDAQVFSMGYHATPKSISIADVNNDKLLDIIVANYGSNYVEILRQTCN
ncbi:unnamed protein product [Adineta ricciae]|uniref:Uncharacterized protein n=1 Tax=Adineta ricciae TaxID=249248 RepID=A0A814T157_ADIRI|nr:unnamed protein product [Adineta ricciae]CAF1155229.1 unnamed protein product [Adineta ricciae]